MPKDLLLDLSGISKSFGATRALKEVSFNVHRGEVHALIGENGAGKSTLMKVLSGAHRSDSGAIRFKNALCDISSPAVGRALGIAMIYQELNLAPHLTVEENLMLGKERSRFGFLQSDRDMAHEALELLGHPDIPLDMPAGKLSIGHQQIVEIGRSIISKADLVIMDEPTSSLSASDTRLLFETIGRLKDTGISIIYISHFLEEVMEIADQYTVLRDGASVGSGSIANTSTTKIIELMVGRSLAEMFPRSQREFGRPLLTLRGLRGTPLPSEVSLQVHAGEVLGIAGLVGAGRSETLRSIFGLERADAGTIQLGESEPVAVSGMSPRKALRARIDLLSENRKEEGLATGLSISENTSLSSLGRHVKFAGTGLLDIAREQKSVAHRIHEVGIRCEGPAQRVQLLSGGNQQKVALARLLEQDADILLLDEPTRGIDVGSKVEIYRLIDRLAHQGKAIVVVSSYLPELFGICDRLSVMNRGVLGPARPIDAWTEHDVMLAATTSAETRTV